jgi:hypothetical protein
MGVKKSSLLYPVLIIVDQSGYSLLKIDTIWWGVNLLWRPLFSSKFDASLLNAKGREREDAPLADSD